MTREDSKNRPARRHGKAARKSREASGVTSGAEGGVALAARARALKEQADVFAAENRFEEAEVLINELLSIDREALAKADIAVAREMVNIAYILLPSRLLDPLRQLLEKAIDVLRAQVKPSVSELFVPLHMMSVLYKDAGKIEAWNEVIKEIVASARVLTETIDESTRDIFLQWTEFFEQLDRFEIAAIFYRHVHRFTMTEGEPGNCAEVTQRYCRMLMADGHYDKAIGVCERSLAMLEERGECSEIRRLQFLSVIWEIADKKGDGGLDQARSALEDACNVARRSEDIDSSLARMLYHKLALIYIEHRVEERYEEAERLLKHAMAIIEQYAARESSEYASEVGELAILASLRREFEHADALFQEAFRLYEAASDTHPADFAWLLTKCGYMYLQTDRPAKAVDVFLRAMVLWESLSDIDPQVLAVALSNLATAYFECDKYCDAIRWYRQAMEVRYQTD